MTSCVCFDSSCTLLPRFLKIYAYGNASVPLRYRRICYTAGFCYISIIQKNTCLYNKILIKSRHPQYKYRMPVPKDGGNLGKKDTITKEYMRNPIVFADAFNKYLYHGRQVIKPEKLKELDTTEIAVPYGNGNASVPEQRYRDVLKTVMTDGNTAYCILGIENASDIHYAIPVKNGLYDFLQLARQVSETAKSHKRREKESICAEGDRPS